ncbi:MAG: transporter substrate-binding domain-containing protein [Desulfobacterales bacterium]|nr:transporter substrate-binding domain-containing protein [Desulfobacterales bacterium]
MKKRNRLFQSLCVVVFTLSVIVGIHFSAMAGPSTVTWVYMDKAEPHNWNENGVAKGIQVEIAESVLGQLGIQVIHKFYPWERAQRMVEKGKADAMMTTPTSARFKYAVFGKENVLPNYWNLFIRKGNTRMEKAVAGMTKLEDLKGYRILDFIGNGWTAAFMKKPGGYTVYEVATMGQIPLMLANGREDLAINSSTLIHWWSEKQGVQDRIQEFETDWPWTRFHYVFMLSRKSPWAEKGLIRAMDEELKKMKNTRVWHNILSKYTNPHGSGKSFTSFLDQEYEKNGGFYTDYDSYPIYRP